MYGVVLWSDASENKAVFWCEDQGDLAYFAASHEGQTCAFDAGDLVEFDVIWERKLRTASNPRVIQEKADIDLPNKLLQQQKPEPTRQTSAKIVPFPSRHVPFDASMRVEKAETA